MSRASRRRKRRARAERVGHGRGRGQASRTIWLNPPGATPDEMLGRLLRCVPAVALRSLASTPEGRDLIQRGDAAYPICGCGSC